MSRLNRVGGFLLALFVAVALVVGISARTTANHADTTSSRQQVATVENDYLRAKAACKSSTQLRRLLDDIDSTLKLGSSTNPEALAVHKRIHRYTDTNPNCEHLPPKPVTQP